MRVARVAIVGVGMIGATLGRALRRARPGLQICGYDPARPVAGAPTGVDSWVDSAEEAFREADLVVLATPVASILELIPRAARACRQEALVTDTGSTKSAVCRAATESFRAEGGPHFVGGHPMAGSERGGAAAADPDLLRGAAYALCPDPRLPLAKSAALETLLRETGARPVWIDAQDHDRIVARVSHLPQMLVVALASLLEEHSQLDARLPGLAGSGLRDLLRVASSPYPLWRDICRTNAGPLREAIAELGRRLQELSADLEREALERWFDAALHFRAQRLRGAS